jgi:hypothetical protein
VHDARTGKTECLAGSALETRAQRQMLALDLLHQQLSYRVLLRRKMTLIDPRLVCVIMGDANGCEQGAEFQNTASFRVPRT